MQLSVDLSPNPQDIAVLRSGLSNYNLAQEPALPTLRNDDFTVILTDKDQIVAGAICELAWGWLYFDTVWTDDRVRGQGYGTRVMQAAESYAKQNGINHAYLLTTSFQARPFYEKLGYETFGDVNNLPNGHQFYYLRKYNLAETAVDTRIEIQNPPIKTSANVLENGLRNKIAEVAPLNIRKITIFLRDDDGQICGGLLGNQFWDWFDLKILWVDDRFRGQGWGAKIIQALEAELRQRHLTGIVCETTSFQALPFYQTQGFEIIGTLKDRPPNHTTTFLKKYL